MHPNSKSEKKCTRCKKILKREFFANGKYGDYRDYLCFYCIMEKKGKKNLNKRKKVIHKERIKLLGEIKEQMIETKRITGFSDKFIKKLLTRFTHSEIRSSKIENGKILIKQLY